MTEKIINIGGLMIHRYYHECPYCGGELRDIMMYGTVCIDCDDYDLIENKESKNKPIDDQQTDKND